MKLEVRQLSFSYGDRPALKDISFCVEKGEFLSVLGPNGAGKSTLFRCVLGILPPKQGTILLEGKELTAYTTQERSRRIAYIPQSHNPVFQYTVLDMVLMGTTAQIGPFSSPGEKQKDEALTALKRLNIEHLANRSYRNISGGERQMVLIARALAQQATVLLMDEPTSSLDFGNRALVMKTMKNLSQEGYSVIQSTHDPDQAYRYSNRILALQNGKVLAWDCPQKVICSECMTSLYRLDVTVASFDQDSIRTCIPKERKGRTNDT